MDRSHRRGLSGFVGALVCVAALAVACGGGGGGGASGGADGGPGGSGGVATGGSGGATGGTGTGGGTGGGSGDDGGMIVGTGETVSMMVGAEGGEIELTNATLTIAAGAVATTTMITVTETTMATPAGYRAFSPLYQFEPAELVFAEPVTVSIRSRATGADLPLGTLFWSQPASEGGGWAREGGIPTGGNVVGTVEHFSYGFLADGVDYTETPDRTCVQTRVLDMRTLEPSGVGVFFAMDDCWGRPLTDLTDADARVFEDGVALSSEASARLFDRRGLQIFVTLAIDVSSSTRPILPQVIAAARRFVETLNDPARGLRDRVQVAIIGFAGEASAGFIEPHTLDLDRVLARLDELATYTPPDASSTNLNGALVQSLGASAAAQQAFRDRNRGGAFTGGYVVVFTDGTDTSGRVTLAMAQTQLGESADDVVAVGLQGADYDPAALRAVVGDRQVIDAADDVVLDRDFAYLAARIAGQVRRSYLVGYCSPKRSGMHTVHVGLRDATETRVSGAPSEFDASAFTGGCTVEMFDPAVVCAGAECGGYGCGACDDRVAQCDASAALPATAPRTCISHCAPLNQCSGATVTNPLGYEQLCAMSSEATSCGGRCTSLVSDEANCGACGDRCGAFRQLCIAGNCECPAGEIACDAACQPASYLATTANCGTCGNRCTTSGQTCVAGSCECPTGEIACAGACRPASYFATSTADCGTCGSRCTTAGQVCAAGICGCPSGETACGGACRAPSYFATNAQHCGTCGNRCVTGPCSAGACVDVAEIATGGRHSCARLTDGTVRCWGFNNYGQLGDGTTAQPVTPVAVSGITTAVEIATGDSHSCARLSDGTVRCWGLNFAGQLGDGTMTSRALPVAVSSLTGAVEIAVGGEHSCARLTDGTVRCWGQNVYGQLGDGTREASSTPVTVSGLSGAVEIALGGGLTGAGHTCARLTDGTIRCWGSGILVGDDTVAVRPNPVMIAGITNAVEIALGGYHSCARLSDGTVRCWGNNDYGQLGDGTTVVRLAPVAVSGLGSAAEITSSCARLTDGTVRCWGNNLLGQLGDGTMTNSLTPVAVSGLSGVAEIATRGHSCARLTDGAVRCWGYNAYGQLGDGTATNRLAPVSVVW